MIFSIADDLLIKLKNGEKIERQEYIFEQLYNLIRSKNNVLLTESKYLFVNFFDIIKNDYDEKIKVVLKYLYESYVQYNSLKDIVKYRVILNLKRNIKLEDELYITWEYLMEKNINLSDKVTILTEDARDGKFYKELVENSNIICDGTNLRFHYNNGGGSSMDYTYSMCIENNEDFIFIIVDSDKKHPQGEFGKTCNNIKNKYMEYELKNYLHSYLHVLNVHEKENLLMPSEYLKMGAPSNKMFNYLLKVEKERGEYLLYYDLKRGIKNNQFTGPLREYYSTLLEMFPELEMKCGDLKLPRFSDVVKKDFEIKDLDTNPNSYLYDIRLNLCNIIYSFGISIYTHIA